MVTVHEVTAGLRHTQDARRPGVTGAQTWRAWLPQPVLRHRDGHVLGRRGTASSLTGNSWP